MVWAALGSIYPELLDWQPYPVTADAGALFRVRQQWMDQWPGVGYCLLSAVYGDAGRFGFRRIYADYNERSIILPVPESLSTAGFTTRTLEIKFSLRARIYADAQWQVSVDQWIPD